MAKKKKIELLWNGCADCKGPVEMLIDPFQTVGDNKVVCVTCRVERIKSDMDSKRDKKVRNFLEHANRVSETNDMPLFDLPPEPEESEVTSEAA